MSGEATFTKADVDAAVAQAVAQAVDAAVAPLQARLADHEGAAAVAELEAKIGEITGPLEATIAELQTKIDEQTVIAQAEKDRADGLTTLIEEAAAAETARQEQEQREAARTAKITEAALFTAEQLAEKVTDEGLTRLERFVAMSDEAFEVAIETLTEARKAAGGVPAKPAKTTSLVASVDDGSTPTKVSSAARQVAAGRMKDTPHLGSLVGRR